MAGEARKAAAQKAIDLMLDTRGSISRAARLEKIEAVFAEYAAETREQCAQIADKRVAWNKSAAVRFASEDQKSMFDRASANAGEASRIAEAIRSIAQAVE